MCRELESDKPRGEPTLGVASKRMLGDAAWACTLASTASAVCCDLVATRDPFLGLTCADDPPRQSWSCRNLQHTRASSRAHGRTIGAPHAGPSEPSSREHRCSFARGDGIPSRAEGLAK